MSSTTAPILGTGGSNLEPAGQGFNIARFKAKIEERGIQKNNKFLVRILAPMELRQSMPGLAGAMNAITTDMEFWCDAASVPGVAFSVRALPHFGYGPMEKKPVAPTFNDMTLSIINDGQNANWNFFQQWMNFVVKWDNRDGFAESNLGTNNAPINNTVENDRNGVWEINYKNSYTTTMEILEFNDIGTPILNIRLQEAYPIMVKEIPLNWADNTNVQRIAVDFTFRDYYNWFLDPAKGVGAS